MIMSEMFEKNWQSKNNKWGKNGNLSRSFNFPLMVGVLELLLDVVSFDYKSDSEYNTNFVSPYT